MAEAKNPQSLKDVTVEPMNLWFAKAMEVMTYIGLIIMVFPGLFYLAVGEGYVHTHHVVKHWHKPAHHFWQSVKGIKVCGYSWFLTNLHHFDCLSKLGIVVLALAPLAALIAALSRAEGKYKIILLIAVLEVAFSIIRPLIMVTTGH